MSERGYIDNVPLRLTTKYYPQPRPQFKEIDIHIPIDALQDDYDFSLERSALAEVSAWEEFKVKEEQRRAEQAARRAEEEEARRQAEELRLQKEEEERLKKEEDERIRLEREEAIRLEEERIRLLEEEKRKQEEEIRKAEEERIRAEEEVLRLAEEERLRLETVERLRLEEEARKVEEERRRAEEVLRHQEEELVRLARMKEEVTSPTCNFEATAGHESSKESSSSNVSSPEGGENTYGVGNNKLNETAVVSGKQKVVPSVRRNTSINLSDFESDTANPFDNVEINSINEMEVLASILKNNSVSVPPSQNFSARNNQNLSSSTGTAHAHYGTGVSQQSQHAPQTQLLQQHHQPTYQQSSPVVNCYPAMHNNTHHHQSYPAQPPQHPHHQQWNYFVPSPGSPSSTPELSVRRDVATSAPPLQVTNQSNNPVTSSNSFTKYYFPLLTSMADSNRDRQSARNNINHGYSQPLPISGATPTPVDLNAGLNPFLNPSHSPVQQFPLLGSLSNPPQFQGYWANDGNAAASAASQTCNMTSMSTPNGPPISASKPSLSHSQTGTDLSSSTANGSQHPLR